jgi:ubiquinone/menaquinone biosynthesis C-methylase UbiE
MDEDIKVKYYSEENITVEYDYKRFGRGGGKFVAIQEMKIIDDMMKRASLSSESYILDCPTGTGRFIPMCKEYTPYVIAADVSQAMLDEANKFDAHEFLKCSASEVPIPNTSIDMWLMSRFLFHFDDLNRFFREASRVVKPDGFMLFDVFSWSPRSLLPARLLGGRTYNHRLAVISRYSRENGFELIEKKDAFFIPTYIAGFIPNSIVKFVEKLTDKLLPKLKTKSYYLLQRK